MFNEWILWTLFLEIDKNSYWLAWRRTNEQMNEETNERTNKQAKEQTDEWNELKFGRIASWNWQT